MENTEENNAGTISFSPVKNTNRIQSLDIIRGISILGILIMNIIAHALPFEAYQVATSYGVSTAADQYTWIISNIFANGTFRALFSILFGVSIILLTQNKEPQVAEKFFLRRCLFLVLFGLFHAHIMLFFGDILYGYALIGMIVLFWRNMSNKKLYWVTGGVIAAKLIIFGAIAIIFTFWMSGDPDSYQTMMDENTNQMASRSLEQIASHAGSYLDAMKINSEIALEMQTFFLPFLFLDIMPLMLFGFILYRTGFITGEKSCKIYVQFLFLGLIAGLSINGYLTFYSIETQFSVSSQMLFLAVNDISRIAIAMAIISAVHIILNMGLLKSLMKGLANIGKMALSCYLLQSLAALILFNGFGFDLFNKYGRTELLYFIAAIWALSFIFSHFWLKSYRYGPVEWLWRSLSYGRNLPLRKES